MRPWESVRHLAERAGAWSCRGRVLGRGQVWLRSARRCAGRTAMRCAGGRRVRSAGGFVRAARGRRARVERARARGSQRVHPSPRSGSFGARLEGRGDGGVLRASGSFGSIRYFWPRTRILCRARLALGKLGAPDAASLFRLASARALLTQRAAHCDCPGRLGVAGLVEEWRLDLSVRRRGPKPAPTRNPIRDMAGYLAGLGLEGRGGSPERVAPRG
jgi:hypothetical protein